MDRKPTLGGDWRWAYARLREDRGIWTALELRGAEAIEALTERLQECERALFTYSGGTSEYFDRHPDLVEGLHPTVSSAP